MYKFFQLELFSLLLGRVANQKSLSFEHGAYIIYANIPYKCTVIYDQSFLFFWRFRAYSDMKFLAGQYLLVDNLSLKSMLQVNNVSYNALMMGIYIYLFLNSSSFHEIGYQFLILQSYKISVSYIYRDIFSRLIKIK